MGRRDRTYVLDGAPLLVDVVRDQDHVVLDVSEVCVGPGADDHRPALHGLAVFAGVCLPRLVVSQRAHELHDGVDGVAEGRNLAGDDVQRARVPDRRVRDDVQLELVDGVAVGGTDGYGEVDDGIDDGLDDHGRVAHAAEDGLDAAEPAEDGRFDVLGGLLEEGDDGVVGAEEDGDLLYTDG